MDRQCDLVRNSCGRFPFKIRRGGCPGSRWGPLGARRASTRLTMKPGQVKQRTSRGNLPLCRRQYTTRCHIQFCVDPTRPEDPFRVGFATLLFARPEADFPTLLDWKETRQSDKQWGKLTCWKSLRPCKTCPEVPLRDAGASTAGPTLNSKQHVRKTCLYSGTVLGVTGSW